MAVLIPHDPIAIVEKGTFLVNRNTFGIYMLPALVTDLVWERSEASTLSIIRFNYALVIFFVVEMG